MPLSSISTLKFRACKNCELGFDNHKNFEEEEWHEHIGNSGEGRNVGCSPLFSRKFPLPDASIVFSNTSKPSPEETRRKAEPPQGGLPSRGRVRLGNRAGCQPAKTSVRPCPPSRKPGFPAFLELEADAEGALEVVFLRFVAHALPQILIQIEADVAEFHEQGEVLVQLVFRV